MQIQCRTIFDITETRITGHFKPQRIPFCDSAGNNIVDQQTWDKARNQQRNFETILQLLQLRTQIFEVTAPSQHNGYWQFEFVVEADGVYQLDSMLFGTLQQDCDGVPMITGLDEKFVTKTVLTVDGSQQNIWFENIVVNNLS
jgi:hypothetical protein